MNEYRLGVCSFVDRLDSASSVQTLPPDSLSFLSCRHCCFAHPGIQYLSTQVPRKYVCMSDVECIRSSNGLWTSRRIEYGRNLGFVYPFMGMYVFPSLRVSFTHLLSKGSAIHTWSPTLLFHSYLGHKALICVYGRSRHMVENYVDLWLGY